MSKKLEQLLENAFNAEFGIAIQTDSYFVAKQLRRKAYAFRERLRRGGNNCYDCLSLVAQPDGQLLIVRRNSVPAVDFDHMFVVRAIGSNELPRTIRSRGPRRLGIFDQMTLAALVKGCEV